MFFISLVKQIRCFTFHLIVKTTILIISFASKGCKPATSLYEVLQEFATGLELSSLVILDATRSMNRTEWYVQKRESSYPNQLMPFSASLLWHVLKSSKIFKTLAKISKICPIFRSIEVTLFIRLIPPYQIDIPNLTN